jgi:hypothetical protein
MEADVDGLGDCAGEMEADGDDDGEPDLEGDGLPD